MDGDKDAADSLLQHKELPRPRDVATMEKEIKELSVRMQDVMNTKNFNDSIFEHCSEVMEMRHDAGPDTITGVGREYFRNSLKESMIAHPDLHTDILDVQAQVSTTGGLTKSWVIRTVSGLADGLRRDVVAEITWEWQNGKWMAVKYRGLRSFPQYESAATYGATKLQEDLR